MNTDDFTQENLMLGLIFMGVGGMLVRFLLLFITFYYMNIMKFMLRMMDFMLKMIHLNTDWSALLGNDHVREGNCRCLLSK